MSQKEEILDRNTLITKAVVAALSSLTDPYHIEYARLLAGTLEKEKAEELKRKAPDIFEFHKDRLLNKVTGLSHHPDRQQIIVDALKEWERLGSPLGKLPEPQGLRTLHNTPTTRAVKTAPRLDLIAARQKEWIGPDILLPSASVSVASSDGRPALQTNLRAPSTWASIPSKEQLVHRINNLMPSQRKYLDILMSFPAMPERSELRARSGGNSGTLGAVISSIFSDLGLIGQKGTSDFAAWLDRRFMLVKVAYESEGILPARAPRPRNRLN